MAAPSTPPPMWGSPVSVSPPTTIDDAARRATIRRSGQLLLLAAALHIVGAVLSWLLIPVIIRNSPQLPDLAEILYAIAIFGTIMQVMFAGISGVGATILFRGGPSVVSAGIALLVVGIIAAIVSILIFGGLLGLVGGVVTAYAGNKVRKPPTPTWIPPSRWIAPPQPPSPPSF